MAEGRITPAEHTVLVHLRREYAKGIKRKKGWTLAAMQQEYELFRSLATRRRDFGWKSEKLEWPEDKRMLEEFYWLVEDERAKVRRLMEAETAIGFFVPSYEQAQRLNAWHPDFDPEAPEGYNSVCDFSAKRVGKTWAKVINNVLWMIPNDPAWMMFEPRVDHLGRSYQVFPRFKWDEYRRSGRRIYDADEPPKLGDGTIIWQGCVDENHWNLKVEPKYRKFMPDRFVARKGKDKQWFKADKYFVAKHGAMLIAKLYNSDTSAWSGDEIFMTSCDEGAPKDKVDEAIARSEYFYMAFTPNEPANIGEKAALAQKMYRGDDEEKGGQPLVGRKKFFIDGLDTLPDHIMGAKKKAQRYATLSKLGDAGKAARDGGFFNSSPLVFKNFERALNVLPWSGAEIRSKFPSGLIIRTFDEGMSSPSACCWTLITPNNEYIIFQEWQMPGLSVGQRCEKIIELSGNEREVVKWNDDETLRIHREKMIGMKVKRTFADSKIFKRDQERPDLDWTENYRKAGLLMEKASNIPPKARCDLMNDYFRPDPSRRHLLADDEQYGELEAAQGDGCRLYISRDCEYLIRRLGEYLWQQFTSGPKRGEFNDKPEEKDDHIIDCAGYAVASKLRWIDMEIINRGMIRAERPQVLSTVTGY